MKALLALALSVQGPVYVRVTATYLPPVSGRDAAIAVQLSPLDPHVRVNEDPAPRLKLDSGQQVLVEKPAARKSPPAAPGQVRYLDPVIPVAFPVTVSARAARGEHAVKGTVTYFYCSKSEGWCRKGSADIEVPVRVP